MSAGLLQGGPTSSLWSVLGLRNQSLTVNTCLGETTAAPAWELTAVRPLDGDVVHIVVLLSSVSVLPKQTLSKHGLIGFDHAGARSIATLRTSTSKELPYCRLKLSGAGMH